MKYVRIFTALSIALNLTACGLPVYKSEPSQTVTKLKTAAMSSPQICANGKAYKLATNNDDDAYIPTGEQIGIASAFYTGDGRVSYSCRPTISFTPQSNTSYVGVLLFRGDACYLQIFREDPSTPTGLAWEPSVRRGGC